MPGPAEVARPTEAGRPVFSCVMRWSRRPAASKIRLPGWPVAPRLGRAARVAKCRNWKNKNIENEWHLRLLTDRLVPVLDSSKTIKSENEKMRK